MKRILSNGSRSVCDELQAAREARKQRVEAAADQLIAENLEAFQELAK